MLGTIIALVAPSLISRVVFGGFIAAMGAGLVWHVVAVNTAYERGAIAARQKCSDDAATVKSKADAAYRLLAKRLEATLNRQRALDQQAVDDANEASKSLEAELQRMKEDPICWTPGIVKEIQR